VKKERDSSRSRTAMATLSILIATRRMLIAVA
jgi:hypothetical protein